MLLIFKVFLLIAVVRHAWCFSGGAPDGACQTLMPVHGLTKPQTGPAPFKLIVQAESVEQGKILNIDIIPDAGETFKGFVVRAERVSLPGSTIGSFVAGDNSRLMGCNSTITHSNANDKEKQTLMWMAPLDFEGDVLFNATIVKMYDTFWIGQKSIAVKVRSASQLATATEFTRPTTARLNSNDPIYAGCGEVKTCFGIPSNCIEGQTCEAFMSITPKVNSYVYEMRSPATKRAAYVAAGLSEDELMGDDSVVECVYENGKISAYTSWTNGRSESSRVGIDQSIVRLVNASYTDGVIYCKVERQAVSEVNGHIIDLNTKSYNLLLATGKTLKENKVGYHDILREATGDKFLLSKPMSDNSNMQSTTQSIPLNADPIYDGCGVNKTCFGIPSTCIESQSCQSFAALWRADGDKYIYEMRSPSSRNAAYIAVGLSQDAQMGDDSVVECVNENGRISAYTSWTNGKSESSRVGINQNIIRLLRTNYQNGVIYCQVERNAVSSVKGKTFDLHNHNLHILLATGSSLKDNKVGYHDIMRAASGSPLKLSQVQNVKEGTKLLLRLHGVFMVTAWLGTTSIGIMLARYFKPSWKGKRLYGKDLWFAGHQICMILTWSLTVVAYIIIFVELDGWNFSYHAVLGTITTIFCFIQPIGAFFRPGPTHEKRPVFNWLHFLGGNVAHILSIVTIFFAASLVKAELPTFVDFILVAYVLFQAFMHLIFSTLKLRNLPLAIYILVIIAFVVGYIYLIVTAGNMS